MTMISFGLLCLHLLVIYFSIGWSIYIINGGQVVLRIPTNKDALLVAGLKWDKSELLFAVFT